MIFRLKFAVLSVVLVGSVLLAGCSSGQNVALKQSFWSENAQQPVVVALAQPPNAELDLSGPRTLVGRVSSRATTIRFSNYLKKHASSNLSMVQSEFVDKLQANGIPAKRYAGVIPLKKLGKYNGDDKIYADLDYKPVAIQLGNDRLLLLSINKFGAKRNYVVVVPTDNPVAFCDAEGRLIDLKTNKILWRYTVSKKQESKDDWDEGSSYRSFMKSLDGVVNDAMQEIMDNFFAQAPNR